MGAPPGPTDPSEPPRHAPTDANKFVPVFAFLQGSKQAWVRRSMAEALSRMTHLNSGLGFAALRIQGPRESGIERIDERKSLSTKV
jgi:hypothetical protein